MDSKNESGPVQLQGIHHIKFCVSDFESSLAFYVAALGAHRMIQHDHRQKDGTLFGVILEAPGLGAMLELRLNPGRARLQSGFDPVTWCQTDKRWLLLARHAAVPQGDDAVDRYA